MWDLYWLWRLLWPFFPDDGWRRPDVPRKRGEYRPGDLVYFDTDGKRHKGWLKTESDDMWEVEAEGGSTYRVKSKNLHADD